MARQTEISTPIQFERSVHQFISEGYDAVSIAGLMSSTNRFIISRSIADGEADIRKLVEQYCQEYKPYADMRLILENDLVIPTNRKAWYLHILDRDIILPRTPEHLRMLFANKFLYLKRSFQGPVSYNPHKKMGIHEENNVQSFNLYKPPFWKEKVLKGGLSYVDSGLPEVYSKFFNHLCDGETESINAILDWISISLQDRNRTFLTTIGSQGIGKGVLSKIISELHGSTNSSDLLFESISKQFNKSFSDKTFVYLDEVNKASPEQLNKLKKQNDEQIEIELKGIDSEVTNNFSNIAISSNYLDSLRLDYDDRRFTVPSLTSKRLEHSMSDAEIKSLLAPANIEALAHHLMCRKYDTKLITFPFKSSQALRLLTASAFEWEKWFLDEFCKDYAGRTISTRAVSEQANIYYKRCNVASKSLELLSNKFKGIFKVKKTEHYEEFDGLGTLIKSSGNKRVNCVIINKLENQKTYDIVEKEED